MAVGPKMAAKADATRAELRAELEDERMQYEVSVLQPKIQALEAQVNQLTDEVAASATMELHHHSELRRSEVALAEAREKAATRQQAWEAMRATAVSQLDNVQAERDFMVAQLELLQQLHLSVASQHETAAAVAAEASARAGREATEATACAEREAAETTACAEREAALASGRAEGAEVRAAAVAVELAAAASALEQTRGEAGLLMQVPLHYGLPLHVHAHTRA